MGFLTRSCQLLFLHFLLHSLTYANLCSYDQSFALLQFKQLFSFVESASYGCIGVHYYPKMEYWKEGTDCCSWDGVTCNTVTGHVIGLDLSCSWLYGSIPSNSTLLLLSHLQTLNLAFNDFTHSQISSDFALLSSLTHLNLSNSHFTGEVPTEISYLSRLVSLDLSSKYDGIGQLELQASVMEGLVQNLTELKVLILDDADMSAIVPASLTNLSSSLTYLSLSFCGLNGNFPESIFQLPNLQVLHLSENFELTCAFAKLNWSNPLTTLDVSSTGFSGQVLLDSISNLMSLTYLSLRACAFNESVPTSLGKLTHLVYLDLSDNNFSRNIPSSLFNFKNLNILDLSHNNFSGNIPSSLLSLKNLLILRLSYNSFTGNIPSSPLSLRNLYILDLSYNNFSGNIPSSLLSLRNLHILDLSYNNFTGKIPNIFVNFTQHVSVNGSAGPILSQVGGLQNLAAIYLNDNSLSGTIPSMLLNLPLLEEMDLSNNYLTGQIDEFHKYSLNSINLSNNRLHGSIPNSLFELVNLTKFILSSNKLSGNLELDKFTKLKNLEWLDLSHNNLSLRDTIKGNSSFESILRIQNKLGVLDLSNNKIHSQMPNWMWHLGKDSLVYLNLSHNLLIGGIDKLSWTSLEYLDLSSNLLQGSVPVPPPTLRLFLISNNQLTQLPHSICNANNIQILTLSSNRLSGTIPECMGSFSRSLVVLDMRSNRFGGSIPDTFAQKNSLKTINLNNNSFEGPVPRSLASCTNLLVLDLGNNKLNGAFPYWLGDLQFLQVLVLRSNKLHGHVKGAHAMFSFFRLKILDISNNSFTGPFPTSLTENLEAMTNVDEAKGEVMRQGMYYLDSVMVTVKGADIQLEKILTTFTTIDLSSNNFQGKIPESIGKLRSLQLLNLSRNSLTGHIPSSIGNLTALESLDLSSNRLVGEIPGELARLNFLGMLNLSRNQLSGPIPRDRHLDTFGNDSYRDNLGLCGFPLSNDCQRDETPEPSPIPEDEGESEFGFGWKVVLMGYGCGMVPGLSMGYIVFSTGKPKWLVRFVEKRTR